MRGRFGKFARRLLILGAVLAAILIASAQERVKVPIISEVTVSHPQFNPSNGEKVSIIYNLSQDATVSVRVYDPDSGLMKYIVNNQQRPKGVNKEIWDGKDEQDAVVPDEAYFFTIVVRAGTFRTLYDPTEFSGGEEIYVETANIDQEAGVINFKLNKPTRIIARAGIEHGPLLATLEDWVARPMGENTIYWNGRDEDGEIEVTTQPGFKMTIGGFELPENSIIAYGNRRITYRDYRGGAKPREIKTKSPFPRSGTALSRHYALDRIRDRSPRVLVRFPPAPGSGGMPELKGRVIVSVDIDERDKPYFTKEQFEIIFSVDGRQFMEETNGYIPYNWTWDTTQFPDGDHYLTINVVSLQDQIGASSKKVIIRNNAD